MSQVVTAGNLSLKVGSRRAGEAPGWLGGENRTQGEIEHPAEQEEVQE